MNEHPDASVTEAIANAALHALNAILVVFGYDDDDDSVLDGWEDSDVRDLYVLLNSFVSRRVGRVILVAGPRTPFDAMLPGYVTNMLLAALTSTVHDPV